jgi:Ferredoxin-dependent bilin reductase
MLFISLLFYRQLTGGTLAAIDFQPQSGDSRVFDGPAYKELSKYSSHWQESLPSGGEMPSEAQRYFSPYALWTRIPAPTVSAAAGGSASQAGSSDVHRPSNSEGTPAAVSRSSEELMGDIRQSLDTFVRVYAKQLHSIRQKRESTSSDNSLPHTEKGGDDESFLSDYLNYRIDKDPAKRLLVGAFGAEWTEASLREVMFPLMVDKDRRYTEGIVWGSDSNNIVKEGVSGCGCGSGSGSGNNGSNGSGDVGVDSSSKAAAAAAASIPEVVTFVTGNAKKREEVQAILKGYQAPFRLESEKVTAVEVESMYSWHIVASFVSVFSGIFMVAMHFFSVASPPNLLSVIDAACCYYCTAG